MGIAANDTLGLRGPDRFVGDFLDVLGSGKMLLVDGVETGVSSTDATGGMLSGSGACHTGHFFASGESAGTSTTSMTSSPANRYRFLILTISFGGSGWDGTCGVATDSWKDAHKASRAFFFSPSASEGGKVSTGFESSSSSEESES